MPHAAVVSRVRMFAAATAIIAAGFLLVPTPVPASPMFPLAPACNQYGFAGTFSLRQDNGYTVSFKSTGPAAAGHAVAIGDSGQRLEGSLSGSISGRHIEFNIRWNGPGGLGFYTGDVSNDGIAHGTTSNDAASRFNGARWDSTTPLACITPADPAPQPAPAPAPIPASDFPKVPAPDKTPAPQPAARVATDVDIYAAPGGQGTPIGTLRKDRQVKLVAACKPNDWCQVVLPELPAGSGWVWSQFLIL